MGIEISSLSDVRIDGQSAGKLLDVVRNRKDVDLSEVQIALEAWDASSKSEADRLIAEAYATADANVESTRQVSQARIAELEAALAQVTSERDALGTTEQALAIKAEAERKKLQADIEAAQARLKELEDGTARADAPEVISPAVTAD